MILFVIQFGVQSCIWGRLGICVVLVFLVVIGCGVVLDELVMLEQVVRFEFWVRVSRVGRSSLSFSFIKKVVIQRVGSRFMKGRKVTEEVQFIRVRNKVRTRKMILQFLFCSKEVIFQRKAKRRQVTVFIFSKVKMIGTSERQSGRKRWSRVIRRGSMLVSWMISVRQEGRNQFSGSFIISRGSFIQSSLMVIQEFIAKVQISRCVRRVMLTFVLSWRRLLFFQISLQWG